MNSALRHAVPLFASSVLTLAVASAQTELAHLHPAGLDPFDGFGNAVAADGGLVCVGAKDDFGVVKYGGAAYLFERQDAGTPSDPLDDTWLELTELVPSTLGEWARFGVAVDVAGDTAVVGSTYNSTFSTELGRVFVFVRLPDGSWVESAVLVPGDAELTDSFGAELATDGETLLVSAYGDDGETGSVRVFRRDALGTADPLDDLWLEAAKLTAGDALPGARFGRSLALDGETALIGADLESEVLGSVYVFERVSQAPESWVETAKLVVPGGWFGWSVSLSGDVAVAGAPREGSGRAYVFERDDAGTPGDPTDDTWPQVERLHNLTSGVNDHFGSSVAVWKDTIAVGAPEDDDGCAELPSCNAGQVYVYRRVESALPGHEEVRWVPIATLLESTPMPSNSLGDPLALEERTLYGGLASDDTFQYTGGSVAVFDLRPGLPLSGAPESVSLSAGGTQTLDLDAGPEHAGELYLVLGSLAGWKPGVVLDWKQVPLVSDSPGGWLDLCIQYANLPPFLNTLGLLDPDGRAQAALALPGGLPPALAGIELDHVALTWAVPEGYLSYASNPLRLVLAP